VSSRAFFEQARDALVGFLPPEWRDFGSYFTSRNLKVWFEPERKEHYEVQLISRHALQAARRRTRTTVLEVGFHAEHTDAARNDDVLARLERSSKRWRKVLGDEPEVDAFVGMQSGAWRRVSELWEGDDVIEPEAAIEAAARLAEYIRAIEPVRRAKAKR
jgi:hypothetical protein